MSLSTSLKIAYKKTLPGIPGYHIACGLLRGIVSNESEWLRRVPVKPGLQIPVRVGGAEFLMCCPERCSIAKSFYWTKGKREPVEDRIALELFIKLAAKADVVLDIGANSGMFSLAAAKINPDAEIVAFDILPEANKILKINLEANNIQHIVDARLTGVGVDGAVFTAPASEFSSEMPSSLSVESDFADVETIDIPIKSLDSISSPEFFGKKMCIKIDVEGTEVDIFRNANSSEKCSGFCL